MSDSQGTNATPPAALRRRLPPAVLFIGLMSVYLSNEGPIPVRDTLVNTYLPVRLLTDGSLTFTPRETPFLFAWKLEEPYRTKWEFQRGEGRTDVLVESWDAEILGRPARELADEGVLKLSKPLYVLTPSTREGRYVNIYGPGAGLSAVPYFGALALIKGNWKENSRILWGEARVFAAACIAGSAVVLYLTLALLLARVPSMALSLLYGLGTCVWCEPSQMLWQQTPTLLFISLGLYFLMRLSEGPRFGAACGLVLGLATLCRPTAGLLLLAAAVPVFVHEKRTRVPFVLAALPPLLFLAGYNAWFLGSPFRFGQVAAAETLTVGADPVPESFFLTRTAGLLISPSRGLFVFSPFLAFSIWGAADCWKKRSWPALPPLTIAFLAELAVASGWFAWFGGWSFGYRILVEWTPVLILLLVPVAERILRSKALAIPFAALGLWSIGLQVLGAYGYLPAAWNARPAYEIEQGGERILVSESPGEGAKKVPMDIDLPKFQDRLWSMGDSQIVYLIRQPGVFKDCATEKRRNLECAEREKEGPPLPR
jgi:hypothetical protein